MADESIRKEFNELKQDFSKLRADIADLLSAVKDAGMERAAESGASLNEELQKRRERLRSALQGARVRGEKTIDDIEEGIAEHPLSSLLMAFGLGFIVAKLINGGRH